MDNLSSEILGSLYGRAFQILVNSLRELFRKLLLYPTELRGLSLPVILYFARTAHLNSTPLNDISLVFTKPLGKIRGFFNYLLFRFSSASVCSRSAWCRFWVVEVVSYKS